MKDFDEWKKDYAYLHELYERLSARKADDEWVEVDYANHAIRPWAVSEHCFYCGELATHKIEETTGPRNFHPLTAYVCCKHFFGGCEAYPYEDIGLSI